MSKDKAELNRIRDLPQAELSQAADRAREELFRLRMGLATNQVENPMTVRAKRRELARIMTVQRARALGLESQAQGSAAAADEAKPKKTRTPRKRKES
jgi:large subunit ribosomal protein L29